MTGSLFRQADWLSPERVRRIAVIFAIIAALGLGLDFWVRTRAGVASLDGDQIGRDFINFWSGAKLAAQGIAAKAYDMDFFIAYERAQTVPNGAMRWYGYPPVTMLLSLPLALTGFITGLILWWLAGYALISTLLARDIGWRWGLLAAFATPAALWNNLSGQNGCFSAALMAGGILLIKRRPWLAGLLFGALCFKPHLAILVPVALAAGGYWRSFVAAGLSAVALCGASALLLGVDAWAGFAHNAPINVYLLETMTGFWPRMPTPFVTVMTLGGGTTAAYALQIASGMTAALITAFVWRSQASMRVKGACLIVATFLTTPYAWDYDLVSLTFVVAWLIVEAREKGFAPYEKFAMGLAIAMPLLTMPILATIQVQPGFLMLWPLLLTTARRAWMLRTQPLEARPAAC
jgi:arabinofuranan 3-O-arabinosyltransferase